MTQAPTPEIKTNVKQGAIIGGWLCFILGLIVMYSSVWLFFIYGPLLVVALILSIVAMAQRRIVTGIVLLLVTLIVPPVLGFVLAAQRTGKALEKANQSIRESLPPGLQQALQPGQPPANPAASPGGALPPPAPGTPPFRWVEPTGFYTSPASQIGVWKVLTVDKAGNGGSISFSPDGSKFAYVRQVERTNKWVTELVIRDLVSREVQSTHELDLQTDNVVRATGWSPDSNRVIVIAETYGTYMVDLGANKVTHLRDLCISGWGTIVWPQADKLWLLSIYGGVIGWEVDLDKLTAHEIRLDAPFMANQEANIAYEKELAKWRDMLPKPLKQGQFRIKSIESGSQHINIMISDNVGEYAKLIGESSAFLLAPDSSCVFAWGVWDKGFTAMYLSVTPSHTHYTVTFGKQDDAAKLVTQLKALVGKGEPVFVQVHKARINPLNQKIVGTEDNSYAGDARVVRVDRDSMQLAVAYDAGIAPGLVASGAYTKQGSQEKVEIPQEEVWGTLEADDRPVTPAREKPPAATEPAPVQADLAPKPAAATEAAQVPLVGGNWSLTTTWANGGTTRGVAKFTVNGNQVQIVATTSFNVLGHDKLQHKAFEQDTFIGTLTGTNLVAQCNSPIATQDGKDVPARGLPFVLKMVVGNDGKSAQGTVSNAAGAVRQVTMSAQ